MSPVSYFLATPEDGRHAWIVRVHGVATEVYLQNDTAEGFAEKMAEARATSGAGQVVFFPR